MKRSIFLCLLSAFLGAFAALAVRESSLLHSSVAQEPGPALRQPGNSSRRPGRFVEGPAPAGVREVVAEEFSAVERTNISVYEKANRSVVHITTKFPRKGPAQDRCWTRRATSLRTTT